MLRGTVAYSKAHDQTLRERLIRPLETVENYLAKHTFLVGERLSLADITAVTVLRGPYSSILGKAERAKYPHTVRFYETVVNQPQVKDILAGAEFAETAQQYVPPQKEQKPKTEKPKAEVKPKAEAKPKAEKKKDDEDEEDEPLVPAEPKKKNPLDDLPKSEFNLEDWKRAYSNLDTRGAGGSLEWFYEKYVVTLNDSG
jgi:elongation factor 1-gamma